jgi:transcriptional regulator with XRE-family HTH domain
MSEYIAGLLAANVRRLLDEKGWSQLKLADECGIRPPAINAMMKGKHPPAAKTLQKIADAFGIEPYELLLPKKKK